MNDGAFDGATGRSTYLNNEANPDAEFLSSASPSPTVEVAALAVAVVTSAIVPDAHIPPSGGKQHTKPFSPLNMKKMTKREKIDTTPAPDTLTANPANASS